VKPIFSRSSHPDPSSPLGSCAITAAQHCSMLAPSRSNTRTALFSPVLGCRLPDYGISTSLVPLQHRHRPFLTPPRLPAQPALPMPSSTTPTWQNALLFTTPPCFYPRFLLGAQPSTQATLPVGQNSRPPKFADTHHSLLPWSKGTSTKNAPMFDPQN